MPFFPTILETKNNNNCMDLNLRDFQRKLFKILLKYMCNNQLCRIEFSESMNVAQFFFAFLK